jgi:23S rRNA (guanine745-N1)-methyltransferase
VFADRILALLRCPVCTAGLTDAGRALVCPADHSFDIARQGSVALLARPTRLAADSPAMVGERAALIEAGVLAPLVTAVAEAATTADARGVPGGVLDVGAGTGAYAAAVLDALPHRYGVAVDLSTAAARRAARAHPRLAGVVADARDLPVPDGSAALTVSVFAPRPAGELARAAAPGGALVVAAPLPAHLAGLRRDLGLIDIDAGKRERLNDRLAADFAPETEREVTWSPELPHPLVRALVLSGPNAVHADPARLDAALAGLPDPAPVAFAVRVAVLRRR